jgi:hypothetical protein
MTPLDELHGRCRHWFGVSYDIDAIDAVLAAAAVDRLDGDPLWLQIVGGPGDGKTETVAPLMGCGAIVVSTISSVGALLSGTAKREKAKDATGGLLRQRGEHGVIVIKDMTSVLSLPPIVRAEILAAFREIYDGRWVRYVGTDGGRVLEWSGRISLVSAVTTAWDRAHGAVAAMGDRWVLLRVDSTQHRLAKGRCAIDNTGGEAYMRDELATLAGCVIDSLDTESPPELTDAEKQRILVAADLVTLARTAVEHDYRGDVVDAHAPEAPTRFAKQLGQVMRGAIAIGLDRPAVLRLAIRCARDSMPPLRLAIIDDLAKHPSSTTTDVRKRLEKPRATTDRQLQALHMLGVVSCNEVSGDHRSWWYYSLADGIDPTCLLVPDLLVDTHSHKEKDSTYTTGTNGHAPLVPMPTLATDDSAACGASQVLPCPCGRPAPVNAETGLCQWCAAKAGKTTGAAR